LFNASRIPLGRMALLCANYIRGKHKPTYCTRNSDQGDVCVIVNAANPMVTGKKLRQKLYRHHTGYAGGLKEIEMRHLIEKDPAEVVYRAVKGMLPKNKTRESLL